MTPGQLRGVARRARQQREVPVEHHGVEAQPLRQLPEDGSQGGAEGENPRSEEVRERRLDALEPLQVRDEPTALDREYEALRHLALPPPVRVRSLQRVEGAVDLDR